MSPAVIANRWRPSGADAVFVYSLIRRRRADTNTREHLCGTQTGSLIVINEQ